MTSPSDRQAYVVFELIVNFLFKNRSTKIKQNKKKKKSRCVYFVSFPAYCPPVSGDITAGCDIRLGVVLPGIGVRLAL